MHDRLVNWLVFFQTTINSSKQLQMISPQNLNGSHNTYVQIIHNKHEWVYNPKTCNWQRQTTIKDQEWPFEVESGRLSSSIKHKIKEIPIRPNKKKKFQIFRS